jgi:hypothetical protein
MLNIFDPRHDAALKWACEIKGGAADAGDIANAALDARVGKALKSEALEALSSPASAAELIRQLVERAGGTVREHGTWRFGATSYVVVDNGNYAFGEPGNASFEVRPEHVVAIVSRLLALAPNAGTEAVLRALRGET